MVRWGNISDRFFGSFLRSDYGILGLLWLLAAICDRLWFSLDQSIPPWDQSAHLSASLAYWKTFQNPQFFNSQWWENLWKVSSSYRGPFVYLATVPFLSLFGRGFDQAALVNLLFTAIILISVYHLGKHLFNREIGLWSAGICILFPAFAFHRTDYLIDYGLTAAVIFTFLFLTLWRNAETFSQAWIYSCASGLGLGLILLAKPTGFLFILIPGLWILVPSLLQSRWKPFLPCIGALITTGAICGAWYQTNWLTIITSALAANSVGLAEGDPSSKTLEGWLYYLKLLPDMVSAPILFFALGCSILNFAIKFARKPIAETANNSENSLKNQNWRWLLIFILGAYSLCTLGTNKDSRFILAYLPGVAVFLAFLLHLSLARWNQILRWIAVGLSAILLIWQLFPLPGGEFLATRRLPYLGKTAPLTEIITEVTQINPYLRSNIGVIPNTPEVNPFSIDLSGNLADFRVQGRELIAPESQVAQDGRSLDWYITKTGEQGPFTGNNKARNLLQTFIEQSPELKIVKTWTLPDQSQLNLYHRRQPSVVVETVNQPSQKVQLESVEVPVSAIPGKPLPVTYQFLGTWEDLQQGLVLLSWEGESGKWLHDHAIAFGQLYSGLTSPSPDQFFRVTEHSAMLPPATLPAGIYTLKATYLSRQSGETYPLSRVPITLKIDPQAASIAAPELDLITQLRQLSQPFSQGKLDPVFQEIGRINQYDPQQDYLRQAEQILNQRLKTESSNLELLYSLAITQVLQRHATSALETFKQITQVDQNNPYAWAYLGFIHLYSFQPQAAEESLNVAEKLNSALPEVKTLKVVSAALKLNLFEAWNRYQSIAN